MASIFMDQDGTLWDWLRGIDILSHLGVLVFYDLFAFVKFHSKLLILLFQRWNRMDDQVIVLDSPKF